MDDQDSQERLEDLEPGEAEANATVGGALAHPPDTLPGGAHPPDTRIALPGTPVKPG